MSWETQAIYDNEVIGNATTSFARNSIAPSEDGTLQPANTRRYAKADRYVVGNLTWTNSGVGSASRILGAGPDSDGTSLIVCRNAGLSKVDVYRMNGATPVLASSTFYTALPTAGGGREFDLVGACIFHGLIVITCERTVSSTVVGITLFYSQDRGVTWNSIDHDTGGTDIPQITGAPTLGDTLGREWSRAQAFPSGGIAADGTYNNLAVFFVGVDYASRGTPEPQGGQCFLFRATRADTSSSWVVEDTRLIYEQWLAQYSGRATHVHTAAVADPQNNNNILVYLGDSNTNNRIDYVTLDLDNYLTDTPVLTQSWHGGYSSSSLAVKVSPQPVSAVPAPGYGNFSSGDETFGVVLRVEAAPSAASTPVLKEVVRQMQGTVTGTVWTGSTPLNVQWYPGGGWVSGNTDAADFGAGEDPTRHYSPDGVKWALLTNMVPNSINGVMLCTDQYIVCNNTSSTNIWTTPIPTLKRIKPLFISRGAQNRMTEYTQRVAPATNNTNVGVSWSAVNGYTYTSGGAPVPNAPSVPPPVPNGILREITCESTSSFQCGDFWVQASGQTMDPANYISVPAWAWSTRPTADMQLSTVPGVLSAYNNDTRTFNWSDTTDWMPIPHSTTFAASAARAQLRSQVGSTSTSPNGAKILVCFGGVYSGQQIPYPISSGAGSWPHEIETVSELSASGDSWSAAIALMRQWQSHQYNETLVTLMRDANNHVVITWTPGTTTLTVTATRGGSGVGTINLDIGEWVRGWPLYILLADDGAELYVTVLSVIEGVQSSSASGASLIGAPTTIKTASVNDSVVPAVEVMAIAFDPSFKETSERESDLATLNFMTYTSADTGIARDIGQSVGQSMGVAIGQRVQV